MKFSYRLIANSFRIPEISASSRFHIPGSAFVAATRACLINERNIPDRRKWQETETRTRAWRGPLVMQNCHESGKCNYVLVDDVDEQPRRWPLPQLQSRHFILDRAQYVHINCIMSPRPTLATRNFEANKFCPSP